MGHACGYHHIHRRFRHLPTLPPRLGTSHALLSWSKRPPVRWDFASRSSSRVGGLGFTGLAWSDLFRALASQSRTPKKGTFGKAKACIIVFNYGGPSHIDMWDLKPDAPKEIRGDFKPAATNVPGIAISEHLPRLSEK